MSKELVISAASHERRVAILEEGQLVEIYIEREKEFALVGSIYKGRVTRVLPGMQSAFVDIGLDGDAFLYVSDVFENLEDYDHGHPGESSHGVAPAVAEAHASVEALPGETLARASEHHADLAHEEAHAAAHGEPTAPEAPSHGHDFEPGDAAQHDAQHAGAEDDPHAEADERQPESNESAPQNFSPHYNPTQNYPSRGNDRPGQGFSRGDRGNDRGGDRGNDRGRGGRGRWGRRGGQRRGGRPPAPGGRNLPPSKYASPQGESRGESRGYENRGSQPRGFEPRGYDNRRGDSPRHGGPSAPTGTGEEPIVLPGESLAKYRGKPSAAPSAPVIEEEAHEPQPNMDEISSRAAASLPPATPGGSSGPRRFSGGLPRWVLADAGTEAGAAVEADDSSAESARPGAEIVPLDTQLETLRVEGDLSDEEVSALASSLVEAKHEESQEDAEADSRAGGAVYEDDSEEEDSEEGDEPGTEDSAREDSDSEEEEEHESEDESEEPIHASESELTEAEADAAHESAEEAIAAEGNGSSAGAIGEPELAQAAAAGDNDVLLPGETRSPRSGAPREEFPRSSARIGGNPRSRFQRPFRGRGRDRDNRGGRPGQRGGRDRGDRGGRPGQRFERRGPGGPRHDRGHHGHSGQGRRPQLISEMLKPGQDIVIQIAKEPLGKKGARITSHVALPGRFLVYMPTVQHTGVSRKIIAAENRSRLRRLVSEASASYPGGFIVRTAAGGATDDEIRTDIEFLGKTWNEIKQKSEERKAPALLHRDLNLVERILRDYVSDDFTAIWIDSEEEYGKVVEFVSRFQPRMVNRVKLYTKEQPIFEEFGIQHELDKALRAKVWLKSGGYIVINHTEALVAIDVNTGKFVGKGSTRLEDTIVKTNLEAVKEIVRQIRLRDLGGIIVVDFIDMEERRNREKVLSALQFALEQDKAPSKALSFNEFGLVCITRKRTKQALERVLCQPCPYCTGSGMVKSIPTLCYEIQAEARKMATTDHENPNLTLRVHPEIAKALKTRESMLIDELEQNAHKHVIIQSDATLHWEQYDIY
jgi:Rne/Rng family ribonuclease